jgi:hypothetical protein
MMVEIVPGGIIRIRPVDLSLRPQTPAEPIGP